MIFTLSNKSIPIFVQVIFYFFRVIYIPYLIFMAKFLRHIFHSLIVLCFSANNQIR